MSSRTESLSAARLQHLDRHLQRKYLDTGRLPCAVTLIEHRGHLAHFSALGHMDVERARAVQKDTIFRIYSMTKPVTSVAFMMLVEDGLVALDDPVDRYIPQWRDLAVFDGGFLGSFRSRRASAPMRIVDLLRHTSGLTYGLHQRTNVDAAYRKLALGDPTSSSSLEQTIEALATIPLEFSPGESWTYSLATDVLGYLIGKLSGEPFEDFLRNRIFGPLRMEDTGFFVPADKAARFATCYIAGPESRMRVQDDAATSSFLRPPSYVAGGSGLVSTASDYLRFCRMLLDRGSLDGARIIGPKTLQLMTANHLPGGKDLVDLAPSLFSEATYSGVGFGLGFAVTTSPARALVHGSAGDFFWGGLAGTYFWIDPREELITIFMTQLMPSNAHPIRRELRTLVYSAIN